MMNSDEPSDVRDIEMFKGEGRFSSIKPTGLSGKYSVVSLQLRAKHLLPDLNWRQRLDQQLKVGNDFHSHLQLSKAED